MPTLDQCLNQREAAAFLQVTPMSIQRWEKKQSFPPRVQPEGVFGHEVYYLLSDVEKFKRHEWSAK